VKLSTRNFGTFSKGIHTDFPIGIVLSPVGESFLSQGLSEFVYDMLMSRPSKALSHELFDLLLYNPNISNNFI
jgi:hypothetical protein